MLIQYCFAAGSRYRRANETPLTEIPLGPVVSHVCVRNGSRWGLPWLFVGVTFFDFGPSNTSSRRLSGPFDRLEVVQSRLPRSHHRISYSVPMRETPWFCGIGAAVQTLLYGAVQGRFPPTSRGIASQHINAWSLNNYLVSLFVVFQFIFDL